MPDQATISAKGEAAALAGGAAGAQGQISGLKRVQRSALLLLVLAGLLNYMDRSALAIANPLVRKDLGLSLTDMGLLLSAFLWAYAFAQLPAGLALDRLGRRRTLALALGCWSLAQAACGLVSGLTQFVVARVVLGVGEAPMFPAAAGVVRDWYPAQKRGFPTGCWNSVSTLAPTLAPPVLTFLMLSLGWRAMFIVLGATGVILAAVWTWIYRDRSERKLTAAEQAELAEPEDQDGARMDLKLWAGMFRHRMTWGLFAGYFGVIYILWLFSAWLPGYLEIQRHMSIRDSGAWAAVPFAFGVLGSISSGALADRFARRDLPPIRIRKLIVGASLLGMATFTALTVTASSAFVAIAYIAATMFFNGCATSMAWAMVSVAAPRQSVGSLGSVQNFGGYLGGAAAPLVTGVLVERTGSFDAALLSGAGLALLSCLVYMFVVPHDAIPAPKRGVV